MSSRVGTIEHPAVRVGALALVSAATALAFGRVFSNGGFIPELLVAALVPHAVGLAARLRAWSPVRSVLGGILATALALVWIVAGETTAYGIPTGATLTRVAHLVDRGWAVFRTGIAPVTPTTGVVLLCAIAVAVAAIVADAVGRRPDVTLGALAPTLVLFVLTGTLGTGSMRIPATVAYIAAGLVALVIANAARVTQRRTWFTGRRLASDAATVRSAAFVGGIAILAGVVVTPLVPGVDSPALVRYRNHTGGSGRGAGSDYTTVSPLVDLKARLGPRSDVELFRVTSPSPLYWRLVALDRFDGQVWSVASEARDAAATFQSQSDRRTVRQQFAITGLGDQWVPAAFTPVRTTMGNARVIPDSSTLIAPNPVTGQNYEIQSRIETPPTAEQIAATAAPVPSSVRSALALPNDFSRQLRNQAHTITAGAGTPYARAKALETFFSGGDFTYDVNVDFTDSTEGIAAFLRLKRGFCQQFAAAFAALARAEGLPSRVVVGFTPGSYDAVTDEYVVRGRDAHAWAEVWFAGLGWRTFEPTPAGPDPGQADSRAQVGLHSTSGAQTTTPTTTSAGSSTTSPGGSQTSSGGRSPRIPRPEALISTQRSQAASGRDLRLDVLLALAGTAASGLLAWALARVIRRRRIRRRRREAPEPATAVAGAWRDALDACAIAGLPVSIALTPEEQVRAFGEHGVARDALEPLRDLAVAYSETEFSGHTVAAPARDRAWTAADELRTALLVGVGARERVRRSLRREPDYAESSP